MFDGIDVADELPAGRVDISQQLGGQRRIAFHDSFDFREIKVGYSNRLQELEVGELEGRDLLVGEHDWFAEEVTLKIGVAQPESLIEFFSRLDFFGQKLDLFILDEAR